MSRPVEFDKPPSAPIRADSSDEDLEFHETNVDTGAAALLRDKYGNIVYPGQVPPGIDSPEISDPNEASKRTTLEPRPDTARSTHDHAPKITQKPIERPSIDKKFVTDLPQRIPRQTSTLPVIKRTGTNISEVRQPTWHQDVDTDDSSSSSSDDEDEDGGPTTRASTAGSTAKPKRKGTSDRFGRFNLANEHYNTKGKVKKDGRLNITVNDTSNTGYLAKALGGAFKKVVEPRDGGAQNRPAPSRLSSTTTATSEKARRPKLNIVIMVIGSRGDAQPFLKIGKVLKEDYGHRVRIATHPAFRDFVEKDSGLEFFSVGGDPSELMAFMVKNPGMIPKLETVKAGDIGRRRAAMAEMFEGFWRACINATDSEKDPKNLKLMGDKSPFVADAIIANPPSFAHIHCAEALGIPLHLMFTFPYTPTQAFPHPLATIKKSNVDPGYTNFMSYPLVEMMVWQGLGDLVNDFRVKTLGLDPVSTLWAPGSTYRLHVPFTYLWSPGIVPKPQDWGDEIDVAGFVFLDLASNFKPPQDLVDFLDAGDTPIYIGFGSIVVDDADKFTEMIFEAVKLAGVRALVSKGWGGLGGENTPDNIFMLENTPHDWLFPKVRACVIHGGAGTTAAALKCGKPIMVVPFFGDQHFWGSEISQSGAGPEAVPYKKLSAEKLAEGIKYCLTDEALEAVQKIAKSIELEGDGAKNAVHSFHKHLTLSGEESMRCSILSDRVAVWKVKDTSLKLSAVAADILNEKGYLSWSRLRLLRHKEWNDFEGPGEPITGIAGTLAGTAGQFFSGIGSVPYRLHKVTKRREEHKKKKEDKRRKRLEQKKKAAEPKPLVHPDSAAQNGNAGQNDNTQFPFPLAGTEVADQQPGAGNSRPVATTQRTNTSLLTTGTTPGADNAAEQYAEQVGEGFGQSGKAIARAPVDLAVAVAQGFHNAPRLYGDDTVRKPVRITGIKSGFKAAGSEFTYGIYDGVTGLVRLPVKGAKERGVPGAVAGVAMGIGGFVLKDISAIISPFGYALKGVVKQAERRNQPIKYIRRARIVQAQDEMKGLSPEEKKTVSEDTYHGWDVMRQLGEVIMQENGKQGFLGRIEHSMSKHTRKGKQLGKWGNGRAFESVDIAQKAIAAIKRGEDVDAVLGWSRMSDDVRKSLDTRREQDKKLLPGDTQEAKEVHDKARRKASKAVQEDLEGENLPPRNQDEAPLTARSPDP
ncbi:hypothetical protein BKA67DRAFT_535229 [Truncatella angustata]|uniref:Glycosyltransferase family 28 N-terminal domain-containing protein n=1 Tax=Truncatella angustata TaxID=152316 RepID=A0A9P8ZWM2_9PEZI|nr:uncharacterized protein BKA67DRAFT_535229 [Truncatella angustata]KAH6653882.1 hypothetical protein BKA67DRAFT_535229 [Truncatella angustata]KAH8196621.1 hypothetical protein TruAng_009215 [Truncatella angustata]